MKKFLSAFLAVLLIVCCSLPVFAASVYESYRIPTGTVRMIAHRGYSSAAPENTLPAFRLAGEAGFWGAECDTSPTADGVWIIMHDNTVDRTTDGEGKVSELTYAEISALTIDAGANVEQYPGTKVPTLTEYLDVCREYGLHPVIEIKSSAKLSDMDDLCALLSAREEKEMFVLISFERELISRMKALMPETPAYLLASPATQDDIDFCLANGLDGIDFSYATPEETVKTIKKAGLNPWVWTVDDVETAEKFYKWGVRDITTNALTQNKPEGNAFQRCIWKLRDLFYRFFRMFRLPELNCGG